MEAKEKIPEELCIANSCFTVLNFFHSIAEVSGHDQTNLDINDVLSLLISNWLVHINFELNCSLTW